MIFNFKDFNSKEFNERYRYDGELGAVYSKDKTIFRVWSKGAEEISLKIYGKDGHDLTKKYEKIVLMKSFDNGLFEVEIEGDLHGVYYNYIVKNKDKEEEAVDIYAKATSVNGKRGMVVNMKLTNPENFESHEIPKLDNIMDTIIYEMHVRDFTIDSTCNVDDKLKGKFLGVVEENKVLEGTDIKVGFDHLLDLGVNTIHLLPSFDYKSVDESKLDEPQYNWGYDPDNYNVPEGSYSTNPYLGEVRIREFKEMIQKCHEKGLRVVMDVVYNHTFETNNSNFNKIFNGYYYRQDEEGNISNGSDCGNETASERYMVRKFIIDSVLMWAKEYKIDGFRFDLMALHDIETIKLLRRELDKIDKNIIIYGEGWTGAESALPDEDAALKLNMKKFGDMQVAAFSDDIRDAIKGSVFYEDEGAFINGEPGFEESIKFGVVASIEHDQIDYEKVEYSEKSWANEPYQTITYASAHDNYTLWDKISIVEKDASLEEKIAMNKLAAAIVLTSQGIPFIHAGDEMLRTKTKENGDLVENSYNSPDYVNRIDWSRKKEYKEVFDYYKGLIELRKKYKVFKLDSAKEINNRIRFLEKGINFEEDNVVAYSINCKDLNYDFEELIVILNGNKEEIEIKLDYNKFKVILNKDKIDDKGIEAIDNYKIKVKGISCVILKKI